MTESDAQIVAERIESFDGVDPSTMGGGHYSAHVPEEYIQAVLKRIDTRSNHIDIKRLEPSALKPEGMYVAWDDVEE